MSVMLKKFFSCVFLKLSKMWLVWAINLQIFSSLTCTFYSNLSYSDRLSALNLPSLCTRREYFDLVEVYKILHGLTIVGDQIKLEFCQNSTRGHTLRLRQPPYKRNIRQSALFTRIVLRWNALPQSIVDAKTFTLFKSRLRHHLYNPGWPWLSTIIW